MRPKPAVSKFDFLSNRLVMQPDCLSTLTRRVAFSSVMALPESLACDIALRALLCAFARADPHHLVSESRHLQHVQPHIGNAGLVVGLGFHNLGSRGAHRAFGALHVRRDFAGPFPTERVVDDHGHAAARRVHPLIDRFQRAPTKSRWSSTAPRRSPSARPCR